MPLSRQKNQLLRETIETKMQEYELLLRDLSLQLSQLELERGYKLTKEDIFDFISFLLQGDKNDKEYQKRIIDHLVYKVFVSDSDTVVYFDIKGGKDMEPVSFEETMSAVSTLKSVQTLSPLPRHLRAFAGISPAKVLFSFPEKFPLFPLFSHAPHLLLHTFISKLNFQANNSNSFPRTAVISTVFLFSVISIR